ncbi:MAG: CD1375 family protein [Veillonellaceae bacterium]|nr:CD1375 family protein [Veillonellaceae bacterium]
MAYKNYKGGNSFYDALVRLYYFTIITGKKTIDDVPATYKDDVAEYLKEHGE